MSQNQVMFAIVATPANAELIDKVSKLILGDDYTAKPEKTSDKTTSKPEKTEAKDTSKATTSLADFKKAAKAAKDEFGEEFVTSVIEAAGIEPKQTLARSVAAVPEEQYDDIIALWQAGPEEAANTSDDSDDDFDDDDSDDADVTPEAVKTAVKAYAKENGRDEAKELMAKHGAKSLAEIDNLKPAQLAKLLEECI